MAHGGGAQQAAAAHATELNELRATHEQQLAALHRHLEEAKGAAAAAAANSGCVRGDSGRRGESLVNHACITGVSRS